MLTRRDATLAERRVRWWEAGSGPAVVVAPGLGLSGRFYERNAPAFVDAGYRFIVPAMPSLGGTAGARSGVGVVESARFLLSFADLIGVEHVHWIGHSLGAQHVLRAAALDPARARSVCLTGPTGGHGGRTARLVRQSAGLVHEAGIAGGRTVMAVLRDYMRVTPVAYVGSWLRASPEQSLAELRILSCPVLLAVGTRDRVTDRDHVARLARSVPDARIAWIQGGGHALPRSVAADFNRVVIRFLGTIERRP